MADRRSAKGRRPGHRDTRGEILTAARHTFAAKGFAGASVRSIAAEAGVDAALVHHYFDTKEQLFLATVDIPILLTDLIDHLEEDKDFADHLPAVRAYRNRYGVTLDP